MIDFVAYYAMLVRSGKISIDKVPTKYRDKVRLALEEGAE